MDRRTSPINVNQALVYVISCLGQGLRPVQFDSALEIREIGGSSKHFSGSRIPIIPKIVFSIDSIITSIAITKPQLSWELLMTSFCLSGKRKRGKGSYIVCMRNQSHGIQRMKRSMLDLIFALQTNKIRRQ
jgi:hypothetical protein